ncbi:MAG: hypothetical protein AMXMBFR84_23800 [Candidatus Hydrogenedentota bacterium]
MTHEFAIIRHNCTGAIYCFLVVTTLISAGCATKDQREPASETPVEEKIFVPPVTDPASVFTPDPKSEKKPDTITFSQGIGTLQKTLRRVAEVSTANLVIMNGIEDIEIGEARFTKSPLEAVVQHLTTVSGSAAYTGPHYTFLYPPGYEPLLETVVVGTLDPSYSDVRADFSFGSGLYLFNVFQWISEALGITVIADNAVGQAECGELTLNQVPLDAALEAILRSARVNEVRVESTGEYIFLFNPENRNPASSMLNAVPPDAQQEANLNRIVHVYLPVPPKKDEPIEMLPDPTTLDKVLAPLSRQLGITVVAEPELAAFPINPAVFHHVRVRTALDLIVRQWLLADYGYQVTADRVVLRKRLPEEAIP